MSDYGADYLAEVLRQIVAECGAERDRIGTAAACPSSVIGYVWGLAEAALAIVEYAKEEKRDEGVA